MPNAPSPLSATVSSVFDAFIKKLGEEQVLDPAALNALKESLTQQRLDPASLREAIFTPSSEAQIDSN